MILVFWGQFLGILTEGLEVDPVDGGCEGGAQQKGECEHRLGYHGDRQTGSNW